MAPPDTAALHPGPLHLTPPPNAHQADYLTEYAEWLISSGQDEGDTAEDVLLAAADSLLEFDAGEGELGFVWRHRVEGGCSWLMRGKVGRGV